jgi:L-amino acid N-acyltransferase YncA
MRSDDWPAVRAIYLEGIATGNATFAQAAPEWEQWDAGHLPVPRMVARSDAGAVWGWAALSGVSSRCVYAGVAEVSIYVAERARGRGVGRQLIGRLISDSEAAGIWTLQAGIFRRTSPASHCTSGRDSVLLASESGWDKLHGRWRDVMLLERRSAMTGK